MVMIGGAVVVMVVGVIIYMNYGHHKAPPGPSPPPPPRCPYQEKCEVGCYPTGTKCSTGGSMFTSASDACSGVNCCSGGSSGTFLNFSGASCKDKNDGHYPCTCNGVLMNASGVKSKDAEGGDCSIM